MRSDLLHHLAARRHVSLRRLNAPGPDDGALRRILEAAAHAPDHGRSRPWRFILVPTYRRGALGAVFADTLAAREPECSEEARTAAFGKAFHAPCLIVAVFCDDPSVSTVPREEKLISLGCAIQNVLIAAQAQQFASGLASGAGLQTTAMRELLALGPHERAICFIGIGSAERAARHCVRPALDEYFSTL
ncbi:nitroreductase family protein [Massilia aerilata]|uniref:Putative NAD(P)H nitroreductase n=1 Tax=Massilia aerilata TaxID=453817 RepID=A0ABW0RX63_9BURK